MKLPKLVIFDCDGVITETAHLHYESWKAIAKMELDIELCENYLNTFRGLSRIDSINTILKTNNIKISSKEKDRLIGLKNEYYMELIKYPKNFSAIQTTINFINELKGYNILIALASASRNAPQLLKALNILDKFDYIVNPERIRKQKPSPDIFLNAAHYFGIDPDFCWGVEDASVGIDAIKSANMFAIGLGDDYEIKKADIKFHYGDKISIEKISKFWSKEKS